MFSKPQVKNKVNLEDYDFRRDIENRILMASLSSLEFDLLNEVIFSSLRFSIGDLASSLEIAVEKVVPILDKLSQTNLLKHDGQNVIVNREMRKYYEFQLEKFEKGFQPNIKYVLATLSKVPIHVLPNWYSVPRTTDNIMLSIVEKYLSTPKIYKSHLLEIVGDYPLLEKIINIVFTSKDLEVPSEMLRRELELSREDFEECMLQLEFYFACFIVYRNQDGHWVEYIAPLEEWRVYLLKNRVQACDIGQSIQETTGSLKFISSIHDILKSLPLPADGVEKRLLNELINLQLVDHEEDVVNSNEYTVEWLEKAIEDQAMLYHSSLCEIYGIETSLNSEKNIRYIEKALRNISKLGWILFDDFVASITEPIGASSQVTLVKKGGKWEYTTPEFSEEEVAFIKEIVTRYFVQSGWIEVCEQQGDVYICVTPFGRVFIH